MANQDEVDASHYKGEENTKSVPITHEIERYIQ